MTSVPSLLSRIDGPADVKRLPLRQLVPLCEELRETIVAVALKNGGHLGSSLGVVELTVALHRVFDFPRDLLVWDVGHQCYAHKLLTGRRERFVTLRQWGGISGFPHKEESPFDPFTCGHSGTSISTALGVAAGERLREPKPGKRRQVVAVIGDGAMASGMPFEALNHGGALGEDLLVILNDNRMSISRSVGSLATYLNRLRSAPLYLEIRDEILKKIKGLPPAVERGMLKFLDQAAHTVKDAVVPGRFFEELGFNYFGPFDGHRLPELLRSLQQVSRLRGPRLVHVLTEKGKGYGDPSDENSCYHSASPMKSDTYEIVKEFSAQGSTCYTQVFGDTLEELAARDSRVVAITAAMCEGTGLAGFRRRFPARFFDVGIQEQHAVGLASGLALAGQRPVVAVYSTFLQRSLDQLFHEIALQKNPVVFALDRAGMVGTDGPTHHGIWDIAYFRLFPGMVLMAPRDASELRLMLRLALTLDRPAAIRYPRSSCPVNELELLQKPFLVGECELLREGRDVALVAYGAMTYPTYEAAAILEAAGISAAVVNARFAKPLDEEFLGDCLSRYDLLVTVEDHALAGGFGSAVLEMAERRGWPTGKIRCLGIPDRFVPHGERSRQLQHLGLDAPGVARAVQGWRTGNAVPRAAEVPVP